MNNHDPLEKLIADQNAILNTQTKLLRDLRAAIILILIGAAFATLLLIAAL